MRRFWIMVAGMVAVAGVGSGPGIAYAGTDANHKASSCSDLVKKYQKASAPGRNTDFSNPQVVTKLFKDAAKQLKSLAKTGPSELRPSFKRLAAAVDKLSKVDFSNPSSVSQLPNFAVTYRNDLQKIAQYFATKCNVTNLSVPTT